MFEKTPVQTFASQRSSTLMQTLSSRPLLNPFPLLTGALFVANIFISLPAQQRRITFLVFWIITAYLVCWLPYLVTRVLWVILAKPTSAVSTNIGVLSLQLSVIIDPILNLAYRKDLRTTIERLLRGQRMGSITIQTGAFNLGFSRATDHNRHNTRIFVRPKSEIVVDWIDSQGTVAR